jgi:hypothetical protein
MSEVNNTDRSRAGLIKDYTIISVVIFLTVTLGWFSVRWVTTTIELRSKISQQEDELAAVNKDLASLDKNKEDVLNMEKNMALYLLPQKPVFEALNTISNIAKDNGVLVEELSSSPGKMATESAKLAAPKADPVAKSVAAGSSGSLLSKQNLSSSSIANTPPDPASAKRIQQFIITLKIEGTFDGIHEFIKSIGKDKPLVNISELRISTKGKNDLGDKFSGELDIIVYWMPNMPYLGGSTVKQIDKTHMDIYQRLVALTPNQTFITK